jgi:ligand-binding SRPBCC domain-containing protein
MPRFVVTITISRPLGEVFEFLRRPANLPELSPPDLHLRVADAPERLELGSRLTLLARHWGVPQRSVHEVTALEPDALLVEEQREGLFRRWVHAQRFAQSPEGTQVTHEIEFEPPGGLLGLAATPALIERELRWIFDYRERKLQEVLPPVSRDGSP